jgi:hypothetical protein
MMNLNILHSHVVMSDTYDYKCSHGSSHKMKVLVYNFLTTFFLIKYFFNFKISFKF